AMLLAALLATGVMVRTEGVGLASVGLPLTGAMGDLVRGLALGTVVAMLAVLLAAGAGGLRWERAPGGLIEYGATGLWTLAILLVPATAEEVVFRGYPMRTLVRSWGPAMALMVTSAAFAALHGWNPEVGLLALANIGLAGLFLGVLLLKTGSLWWASGAHAGWNVTSAYVADLPLSGLRIVDSPMLEVATGGRTWVTGGAFGLEGGVAATVALCVGTAAIGLGRHPTASRPDLARGSLAPLARRVVPVVVRGNGWSLEEE
ncbi:MAG: CPBP family intramembrane metalloprotease, partial [Gemmatimonadota bacterium]|nr:CPBP family intramembrane metalloprotease [Gemmatimonadota bacterium]